MRPWSEGLAPFDKHSQDSVMPFLNIRVATRATDALRVQEESVGLQKKMTGQGGGCRLFHMLLQTALGLASWGILAARLCILGGSAGPHAFRRSACSERTKLTCLTGSARLFFSHPRHPCPGLRDALGQGEIAANGPCPFGYPLGNGKAGFHGLVQGPGAGRAQKLRLSYDPHLNGRVMLDEGFLPFIEDKSSGNTVGYPR